MWRARSGYLSALGQDCESARNVAGVVPVAGLLADASVLGVNHELAVLVFRQPAPLLDGFLLCFVGRTGVAVDFAGP
jgi:hypothetical protein